MNFHTSKSHSQILVDTLLQQSPEKSSTIWIQSLTQINPVNLVFSCDQFFYDYLKTAPKRKKSSHYKLYLQESRKLRSFYGNISKATLESSLLKASQGLGNSGKNFLENLESRLDVALSRSQFVKTLATARQLIVHKKVTVNHQLVDIPSFRLTPGDLVKIHPESHALIRQNFGESLDFPQNSFQTNPQNKEGNYSKAPIKSRKSLSLFLAKLLEAHLRLSWLDNSGNLEYPKVLLWNSSSHGFATQIHGAESNHGRRPKLLEENFIPLEWFSALETHLYFLLVKKFQNQQPVNFWNLTPKPIHLEVDYTTLTFCYLYSPQRISYPFLIDFDSLRRKH